MAYARVLRIAEADLPTTRGDFRILGFEGHLSESTPAGPQGKRIEEAVALVYGDVTKSPPIVRIHSQCLTGDVFHSLRCDCRQQLELALNKIVAEGAGILLYEEQEGRGIGLMAKLRAYQLQDQGLDTIEANVQLGYKSDHRDFALPAEILREMGVHAVRLITNNPDKVAALESVGVRVVERVAADVAPSSSFEEYLKVKREKMGHLQGEVVAQ